MSYKFNPFSGSLESEQLITLTGDVTGSGTETFAATIANNAVSYAKIQQLSTSSRILGRITAGAGNVEELTGANIATIVNNSLEHGLLTGLTDYDHTQYHTDSRALTWLLTRSTTDVTEGINLYYTQARFDTAFSAKSTTNLTEGTNLYFTDERAQDAVGTILTDTASIYFSYNDALNTISAVVLPAGVDHGGLGGLADDDHTQYIRVDGTRAFLGSQSLGG